MDNQEIKQKFNKNSKIKVKEILLQIATVFVVTSVMVLGMQYTSDGKLSVTMTWLKTHMQYCLLTVLMVGGVYYAVAKAVHWKVATIFVGLLSYVWGVTNYFKYTMREEFVTGDDVISFFKGELTFTKDDVDFSKHVLYYGVLVIVAVLAILIYSIVNRKKTAKNELEKVSLKVRWTMHWRKNWIPMVYGLLVSLVVGFGIYYGETIEDYGSDTEHLVGKYGLLLSFIPNNTCPHMVTTAEYDALLGRDYVREGCKEKSDIDGVIGEKDNFKNSSAKNGSAAGATKENPNIIIIMSESLYDTDHFDNAKASIDPMAIMHYYQQEYGGGSIAVDIFGGGTANTEFEFLTGIGHKYYAGNLMYRGFFGDGMPSMVKYMNQRGYHTVSIHPYKENFFNRKTTYKYFGFDQSYFKENMTYTDEQFDVNISDNALTNEIIEKFEQNENNGILPFFNFSVSVGSHKPCLDYDKGEPYVYEQKVSVLPKSGNFDASSTKDIQRYYTAVYNANEAFEKLVEYFSKVDEPTVILLFGDHAPPLNERIYEQLTTRDLTDEELYQTPVVTWNNYDLPKFEVNNINANYLSSQFLSYIGMKLPRMCVYNQNLMKYYYRNNTKHVVQDVDGKDIKSFDDEEMEIEKASLRFYQDALKQKKELEDLWDVPAED